MFGKQCLGQWTLQTPGPTWSGLLNGLLSYGDLGMR